MRGPELWIPARIVRVLREIERHPADGQTLDRLARHADLSPYHLLRTFERVTGVTPHQYLLRTRLRHAAMRLLAGPGNVLDIALDCGMPLTILPRSANARGILC